LKINPVFGERSMLVVVDPKFEIRSVSNEYKLWK
jgi:hypothetical protein